MQGRLVHTWDGLTAKVFIAGNLSVSVTPCTSYSEKMDWMACGCQNVRPFGGDKLERMYMQGPIVLICKDNLKATCLLQEIPQYPSLNLQQESRQLVAIKRAVNWM
jgi:hypothetical protein